ARMAGPSSIAGRGIFISTPSRALACRSLEPRRPTPLLPTKASEQLQRPMVRRHPPLPARRARVPLALPLHSVGAAPRRGAPRATPCPLRAPHPPPHSGSVTYPIHDPPLDRPPPRPDPLLRPRGRPAPGRDRTATKPPALPPNRTARLAAQPRASQRRRGPVR